nr:peptidoglycan-binding protein [Ramlibacter sp.]
PQPAASRPAQAPSAPPAVAPRPTISAAPTLLRDPEQAWRELAQSWKAGAVEGPACRALPKQQLHCFSRNLSLALIRELGRPGILTLDAGSGAPSYALLTALTRDSATLRAAGTEQTVTLAALAARWQGDYATLWRSPPGYAGGLPEGRNETVGWIAARLATVNGSGVTEPLRTFDASLKSELRAFQVSQGLEADGLPGPMTYMQLNRATGIDEPRLRTEP